MAKTGAQFGNQNATQKRPFWAAVNRVLEKEKGLKKIGALEVIAKKLLDAAEAGEQWAIKELADRLDGRSAQQVILSGDEQNPVAFKEIRRVIVEPRAKP